MPFIKLFRQPGRPIAACADATSSEKLVNTMGAHTRFDDGDEDGAPATGSQANANRKAHGKDHGISKPSKASESQQRGRQRKTKSVRSQIRSIERLLRNKGSQFTPASKRAKEEQLKELARIRDEHDRREAERKTAGQYRMIKFFERRKLQRKLDKIVEHGDKPEDAEKKKEILRDMRYINEYPKDKKYISLFPSGGHTDESRKRVEAMRLEIEGKASPQKSGDPSASNADEVDKALQGDSFFLNDESG